MGIDTTDNTDTTTPQEGSSMSDSRDEAIEAGAYPIPAIPFNQMTVDGKLVHAITTNSHGITKLRKYSDSLADTIGEVRKEYMEWEERLKGMRIELTPGEEQPSAMLERLAKHDEFLEFLRKSLHSVTIDGDDRGNRILELAIRATALEEGVGRGDDHAARIWGLEDILKGHGDAPLSLSGMADEVSRISNHIDGLGVLVDGKVTRDDLGEALVDLVGSSDLVEMVQDNLDISSIVSEVQDNLDLYELTSEVQDSLDIASIASEVQDNLDLDEVVTGAMADHGCRVLKENPDFARELCEMVMSSTEEEIETRIHDALKDAVLDGLRRVTSIPAFQEATMLHLRMDELAKSVESVKAMVKDLEHF